MEKAMSYRDIIRKWPNPAALASDLSEKTGTVQAWKTRNNIRPQYWNRLVVAAWKRGYYTVTLQLLADIAASNPEKSH